MVLEHCVHQFYQGEERQRGGRVKHIPELSQVLATARGVLQIKRIGWLGWWRVVHPATTFTGMAAELHSAYAHHPVTVARVGVVVVMLVFVLNGRDEGGNPRLVLSEIDVMM